MSAAAQTSNLNREVRRETCTFHFIEFGQERIRDPETREWSPWMPPNCILCERGFLRERKWKEEVEKQVSEILGERDRRVAADPGRAERITEEANRLMAEDAAKYLTEFFALNRAKYKLYAEDQDDYRIEQEISAERRTEFLERIEKIEG